MSACWLLTGVRQDAWAQAHRIVPEQPKPPHAADGYLHPHLHDAPAHRGLFSSDPDTDPAPDPSSTDHPKE